MKPASLRPWRKAATRCVASASEVAPGKDGGQLVAHGQRGDDIGMVSRKWTCRYDQSAVPIAGKGCDGRLDGGRLVQTHCAQLDPERRRRLDGGELTDAGGNGG